MRAVDLHESPASRLEGPVVLAKSAMVLKSGTTATSLQHCADTRPLGGAMSEYAENSHTDKA